MKNLTSKEEWRICAIGSLQTIVLVIIMWHEVMKDEYIFAFSLFCCAFGTLGIIKLAVPAFFKKWI